MAELLIDERVREPEHLEAVFATFSAERKERGEFLVQSSRFIGDCYEWRENGVGRDMSKIEAEINKRNGIISNVDVTRLCEHARSELGKRLGQKESHI